MTNHIVNLTKVRLFSQIINNIPLNKEIMDKNLSLTPKDCLVLIAGIVEIADIMTLC